VLSDLRRDRRGDVHEQDDIKPGEFEGGQSVFVRDIWTLKSIIDVTGDGKTRN